MEVVDDELSTNEVLSHAIDLSHLVNDGEKPWSKFQLVGLSERDGKIYILAYKAYLPEIGLFVGSSLLPNSFKLITRYSVPRFVRIDPNVTRAVFSSDFSQIGITIRGKLDNFYTLGYCFIIFHLNCRHFEHRPFTWPYEARWYIAFHFSHSCAGWLLYSETMTVNGTKNVLCLSMDPTKDCFSVLLELPQDCMNCSFFATTDYLFCFENDHNNRVVYIFYLNRDGFPFERYTVDTGLNHVRFDVSLFAKTFSNNVLIFKVDFCRRKSGDERCYFRTGEPISRHFCPIYTVLFDSEAKSCRIKKISQFMDRSAVAHFLVKDMLNQGISMVYGAFAGMLTNTKRIALFDGWRDDPRIPKLFLETVFFQPPTLKELCSLSLVKMFCHKTRSHNVELPNDVTFTRLTWTGSLSEEVNNKLGLRIPTLNFGEMEP